MNGEIEKDTPKASIPAAPRKAPTPWRLFGIFCQISAVTIGGGYAMVPVIGRSLEKRGWIEEKEFYDLFAAAQSFPGPLAFTTAIIVGKRLCGAAGAAAAAVGVVIPPFLAIILVGALIGRFGSLPAVAAFLDGAGATVPGLVGAMIWKMTKGREWNALRVAGTLVLALGLVLAPKASLPIFFAGIAILYLMERRCNS
jgi:chromate transporter